MKKKRERNPCMIEDERITIDCYRFKLEVTSEGNLRIYAFNCSQIGDVLIEFEGNKAYLTWEGTKRREILEERIKSLVYSKVFDKESEKE